MFVICNNSYGDPAYMMKNAYIILLIHVIDIELCIFNHSYGHPPEVVNLRWRLQQTSRHYALYLAHICKSITITNINIAHIKLGAKRNPIQRRCFIMLLSPEGAVLS